MPIQFGAGHELGKQLSNQKTGEKEMTKKDFELIAEVIGKAWHGSADTRADIANAFADELESTNPRFDRARFLTACGVN